MAEIIDNIILDQDNEEFFLASELVKYGQKLIYLTGKAGTGKTTFLKYIKATTNKNTAVVAYTGVAAINAEGQTINSFFKIPFGPFVPNDLRLRTTAPLGEEDRSTIYHHFSYTQDRIDIIKGLELLIIDEISMVRCDLLDVVDRLLRVFRRNQFEPFGGVQVILIGDTFQLPPIAQPAEWQILNPFYESPFFFSSKVLSQNKPVYIELKKIYRQNEQEFINLLNKIRVNQVTQNELNVLNSKFNPTFIPGDSNYIILATHNALVDTTNLTKLEQLNSELKLFEATVTGTFPENIMPTERILKLKEGAQVMFIKNDSSKRFYNGKIAKIKSFENNIIIAEYEENGELKEIEVERQEWKNIKYSWNEADKKIEEETLGTFSQFPLKLAWAITVHKSQGLTFEKVIADLGASFASGQVYVALSRCTSFNGLVLKTKIERNAIKTDLQVLKFAENETPNTLILQELNTGKADYFYSKAREDFHFFNFEGVYNNFIKAIKFRNDIETEKFKKYFIVHANKISRFSNRYKSALNEIEELNEDISDLNASLSNCHTSKKEKDQKITEQNDSLKLLLNKVDELQKKTNEQDKKISDGLLTQKNLQNKVKDYERQIADLKSRAESLQKKNEGNELEINRIKNIKWHQKLFGKK